MIRLRTFGICQIEKTVGDDVTVLELQPAATAVLAYLAIARPPGRRRRDELLGIFWPELDDNRARTALRKTLHRIRAVLGEDVVLAHGTDSLELSSINFQCDTRHFENAFQAGNLQECMAWYRGDLLPGFYGPETDSFERWLTAEREHYRRQAAVVAMKLIDHYENNREFTSATRLARIVASLAATDERIIRRVLSMLDRLGDRAGAMQVYKKFADDLWRDYGTRPSRETIQLIESIANRAT